MEMEWNGNGLKWNEGVLEMNLAKRCTNVKHTLENT